MFTYDDKLSSTTNDACTSSYKNSDKTKKPVDDAFNSVKKLKNEFNHVKNCHVLQSLPLDLRLDNEQLGENSMSTLKFDELKTSVTVIN